MPNQHYTAHEEGEPRGEKYGEPRDDDLNLIEEDGETYWQNERGQRVCGAKRRKKFRPEDDQYLRCREFRLEVANRCSSHGGKTPTGEDSPNFKTGRHSKHLPKGLLDRYQKFLSDPEITSLRGELALIDTRVSTLIQTLDEDFGVTVWDDLREAYDDVQAALRDGDLEQVMNGLNRLGNIIERGETEKQKWNEIQNTIEHRRKIAQTEVKRVESASKSLSVEEAMMMVRFLTETFLDVIERYDVPDKARDEVADAIRELHLN